MNNASHIFLYVEVSPVKEDLSNSDRCQWFDQGGDEAAIAQFSLPATVQPPLAQIRPSFVRRRGSR